MNCNKEMLYDKNYYEAGCGEDYSNREIWSDHFGRVADEIIERFHPRTVLDAGCAWGYLVEALRDRGVEAYGIDISEYAVNQARSDIKHYCYVDSLVNEFPKELPKKFDLITNIEILEHLSEKNGICAIKNICSKTDRILFSSTDHDFDEPTHINVKPIEYWINLFAKNNFYHNFINDTKSISEWAVCLEKKEVPLEGLIFYYEKMYKNKEESFREKEKELNEYMMSRDEKISELNKEIERLNSVIKSLQEKYNSIVMSNSWLITKPLRILRNIIRKLNH